MKECSVHNSVKVSILQLTSQRLDVRQHGIFSKGAEISTFRFPGGGMRDRDGGQGERRLGTKKIISCQWALNGVIPPYPGYSWTFGWRQLTTFSSPPGSGRGHHLEACHPPTDVCAARDATISLL